MNRVVIASEILKIAKELMAIEFDTKAEKKKYQQEHDVRPGTKLTVKKDKGTKSPTPAWPPPSKLKLTPTQRAENAIRDHLSGTGRFTTKDNMRYLLQQGGHRLTDEKISKVWDSLVEDKYLVKTHGDNYTWEM
jgi:hypothetical protein